MRDPASLANLRVRADEARAALWSRVVGVHDLGVHHAIRAVANGDGGGAPGESIHARRARAEQRQLIAAGGEDAVELQLRTHKAINIQVLGARRSHRALQCGEEEAFDLRPIGGGEWESRHGAQWPAALARNVQSHQSYGGTITADARQEIVERTAQREAELLYRGERQVERLACHEATRERHMRDRLHVLPAGERNQQPSNCAEPRPELPAAQPRERAERAHAEEAAALDRLRQLFRRAARSGEAKRLHALWGEELRLAPWWQDRARRIIRTTCSPHIT